MKKHYFTITNQLSSRFLLLLVFILCAGSLSAQQTFWGSGSRDLYPDGAQGGRATLYSGVTPTINMPFPNRGVHYVYAKVGETIALASSAQWNSYQSGWPSYTTVYQNDLIRLYGPDGNPINLDYGSSNNQIGRISGRNAEKAGPRLPGQPAGSDRYQAIYHTVAVEGIYRVEFDGTRRGNETITTGRADNILANQTWTQHTDSNYIWAWDVSVANAAKTDWIPGRVYTNVLNMDNALNVRNFTATNGFHGKMKVLTRDGYVYNVDNNGQNGLVFTFMVNNRGFHAVGDPNTPSYSSVYGSSLTNSTHAYNRYSDPNAEDTGSVVTHKIFYTLPNDDLPESSNGAVPGGETWLRVPEMLLEVTDLKVVGAEGSVDQIGSKGAYVQFDNQTGGDYKITIKPKAGSGHTFTPRVISGPSVIGENKIYWDGSDGDDNALPPGVSQVDVDVELKGAEVHFPYIDVEQNANGIIIELLETDLSDVRSDHVYWNDTAINRNVSGNKSNPINASHDNPSTKNGISSNQNGHKWATNTTVQEGTWGDEVGIDTWTFIEGEKVSIEFDVDVKVADFYTEIKQTVAGNNNPTSGLPGQTVNYEVKAGSLGPSDTKGATFTFTVPVGVDIDPANIQFNKNGQVVQAEELSYNEKSRTFTSVLDLPANTFITYTFTGTLSGVPGIKTVESTILRPNDVHDPDATNDDINTPPTNAHYECYNNPDNTTGGLGCNNIQEVSFMLLEDCVEEYLYYEDFDRTTWAENSGRKDFVGQKSISLGLTTGLPQYSNNVLIRDGEKGGATSTYSFAPGIDDSRYGTANGSHSASASVARIKNGYYSVNPPGYVQMGIPTTDSWHEGLWDPNASSNDPNEAFSNYDWTPAWDHEDAIRDVSGAVNGAAFLIRGAASTEQSIKPFYEFDVPGTIANGETYTLSMYSYVTYHDKDYLIMDVVDADTGFIYASVPLKYTEDTLPPGANPTGFSLGWVPLQASVKFDSQECDIDVEDKNIKIAIRGSQDRSLETSMGFGHTLIDDISFTKRSTDGSCSVPATEIDCQQACYSDIQGKGFEWRHEEGSLTNGTTLTQEFTQPGSDGGFTLDIYKLDNSLNMNINGAPLFDEEIEFQSGTPSNSGGNLLVQNIRFKSDKATHGDGAGKIWEINAGIDIDLTDRRNNPIPAIRIVIDRFGNAKIYGKRTTNASLEELELFDKSNPTIVKPLNTVHWKTELNETNKIEATQLVVGTTAMSGFGYGLEYKECEFYEVIKDASFDDNNQDGYAQAGETITYTFDVINAGDMPIYDFTLIDPLFGYNISLAFDGSTNTYQPVPSSASQIPESFDVTFVGDVNENGILDENETWKFTVKYKVTNEDIFQNKGVHNRARVHGFGKLGGSDFTASEESVPTENNKLIEGRDPDLPFHTYVPLQGNGLLITNPMIYQKVKKLN